MSVAALRSCLTGATVPPPAETASRRSSTRSMPSGVCPATTAVTERSTSIDAGNAGTLIHIGSMDGSPMRPILDTRTSLPWMHHRSRRTDADGDDTVDQLDPRLVADRRRGRGAGSVDELPLP